MKNKCIWPVALLAVAGAGLWHFLEVQEGAVAVGDAWMRGGIWRFLQQCLCFWLEPDWLFQENPLHLLAGYSGKSRRQRRAGDWSRFIRQPV